MSETDESASTEAEATARVAAARAARLSLGSVLRRSFAFYLRHLPALVLVGAVCLLPFPFLNHLLWWRAVEGDAGASIVLAWVIPCLQVLVTPLIVEGLVTFAVFQHLSRDGVRYGRSLARGLRALPPILGVALLFVLLIVPLSLLLQVFWGWMVEFPAPSEAVLFLLHLGSYALWALVLCVFFVPVQAVVVERLGPWRAMGRSRRLTRGARWRIFALLLVATAARWLAGRGLRDVLADTIPRGDWSWTALSTLLDALFLTLAAVWTAVVYHDLRRAKEGVGIDELLRVFE